MLDVTNADAIRGITKAKAQYRRDDVSIGTNEYRGVNQQAKEKIPSSEAASANDESVGSNRVRFTRNRNARRLNKTINAMRFRRPPRLQPGQKTATKIFAKGRVLVVAGETATICLYIWLIQLIGFAIQIAGIGLEGSAAQIYADSLVPGIDLFTLGWILSIIAGFITMLVSAVLFLLRRVQAFSSSIQVGFFVLVTALYIVPFNPMPMVLFWVLSLVYTAGQDA